MSDPHEDDDCRGFPWRFAFLIALPLLYVLSIGPVSALCVLINLDPNSIIGRLVTFTYRPILWLGHENDSIARYLSGYFAWWYSLFGQT